MDILERIERSKRIGKIDFSKIACVDKKEALVSVQSGKRLRAEPIWQFHIDNLEGPLYQKYIKDHPKYDAVYVRRTLAMMLDEASTLLPSHLQLVVRAGHRPLEVQTKLLQALIREHKLANPTVTDREALEFARTYVSDPAIKLPPHCCGAAVDVDVFDTSANELVDFGCPINTESEISFLHSEIITKTQRVNRMILLEAMLTVGFASCSSEWWHYSYGDQEWANFYQIPQSLYGIIQPDL